MCYKGMQKILPTNFNFGACYIISMHIHAMFFINSAFLINSEFSSRSTETVLPPVGGHCWADRFGLECFLQERYRRIEKRSWTQNRKNPKKPKTSPNRQSLPSQSAGNRPRILGDFTSFPTDSRSPACLC